MPGAHRRLAVARQPCRLRLKSELVTALDSVRNGLATAFGSVRTMRDKHWRELMTRRDKSSRELSWCVGVPEPLVVVSWEETLLLLPCPGLRFVMKKRCGSSKGGGRPEWMVVDGGEMMKI